MTHRRWNEEFPDVPDRVHQAVLNTFESLEEQEAENHMEKKGDIMKPMKIRTMMILAAAFVMILGTTAAASELFRWNKKADEVFEAEPEVQSKLAKENIAVMEQQSVSDSGLTITAIQTIQDSNCFYALFEVMAENDTIQIDENCGMDYTLNFHDTEDPFCARTWGFVDSRRQEPGSSRYFEIFGTKTEENTDDMKLGIHFTALRGPGEKAMDGDTWIQGNWNFDFTLHPVPARHVELHREFIIGGYPVQVESLDLSPLTGKITCNGEDIRMLAQALGVDFNQLDGLNSACITGVTYEDGTVIHQEGYNNILWETYPSDGDYENLIRFGRVIEPEKATSVLLGAEQTEISLK